MLINLLNISVNAYPPVRYLKLTYDPLRYFLLSLLTTQDCQDYLQGHHTRRPSQLSVEAGQLDASRSASADHSPTRLFTYILFAILIFTRGTGSGPMQFNFIEFKNSKK